MLPGLKIHSRGTSSAAGQGNVVNNGVQAAQCADSFIHASRIVSFARQVTDHRDTLSASIIDQTDGRLRPFAGYVGYRDSGALAREEHGDRLTDTEQVTTRRGAGTRDERPLAYEAVSRINAPPPWLIVYLSIHLDNITQSRLLATGHRPYARVELRVLIQQVLRRPPDYEVVPAEVARYPGLNRGMSGLGARFTPGPQEEVGQ